MYDIFAKKIIWREDLSLQEVENTKELNAKFQHLLQKTAASDTEKRAKLDYIIQKTKTDYQEGLKSLAASKQFSEFGLQIETPEVPFYFDSGSYQIQISVPLRNQSSGRLTGVFDVSALAALHKQLLKDIVLEAALAVLVSFVLILIVTQRLVSPIKRLSKHMSVDVESIRTDEIRERYRRDEIGDLARSFIVLISEIRSQVSDLREKSNTDSLSGLGSRHKYSRQAEPSLEHAVLTGSNFALLICDIDNFKAFNDKYGHAAGDSVIKEVGQSMLRVLDYGDKCYRIGGEEFVILLEDYINDDHIIKADKIRQAIEDLGIEHPGNTLHGIVSISVGMCFIEPGDFNAENIVFTQLYSEMFNIADQQLYLAKSLGRNKSLSLKFNPAKK
ncbi:sensor domain-containing diguanylate cyclase [Vibrio algarum]|uniref:diguanylate cyclase n=1 Tax=Vibrio algarum TaxID=3020714 RepID=A0ABT4YR00_9VIBR|nr:sensor domain-containing diguanylate cyclase [Vibrio sp. KJ40-1]MDB1123986.1 sensor domain-containing diguanylate cyclase [Vibrio sp. KJ40-1]